MVNSSLSAVVFALVALSASAVPVERRESVLSTCNNARLGVISGLNITSKSIEALLSSSNDPVVTSASHQALSGLQTSQGGVAIIVKGVLAGVTPDNAGVPAVANGLAEAAQALTSIYSNDTGVQSKLASILTQLNSTKSNGDTAISECAKLSSSSSNSSSSDSTLSNSNSSAFTETVTVTATATKTIGGAASVQTEADGALIFGFGRRASNSDGSQCDLSSVEAVSAFERATKDIQQLAKVAGSDNTTQAAAQTAMTALSTAGGAVLQIQNVTSAANTVGQSILDAQNSLNAINSTDSSVDSALNSAQIDMISILSAVQKVAIDCTPTAGGVAPGKRRRGIGALIWGH
ncbi:hypothetical protein J3R30DRAFT_3700675 [Lentinula aciculospora]|uniref:Cell wall protein n=1 Tax=Lentinula aciculospora TaxID=153920 RepID=A0A9W9DQS4_9AGAR|nr:hypothetical protein J3R30DRAFT_3700675 [Lentinula aciculospora]